MRLVGIALTLLLLFTASACNTAEEIEQIKEETDEVIEDQRTVLCWLDEKDNFVISYPDGTAEFYSLEDLERITWGYIDNPTQSVMPYLTGAEGKAFFEAFFENPVILSESSEELQGVLLDVDFSKEQNWSFSLGKDVFIFTASDKQYVSAEGSVTFDQLKKVFEK